jgi:hypothetical protein
MGGTALALAQSASAMRGKFAGASRIQGHEHVRYPVKLFGNGGEGSTHIATALPPPVPALLRVCSISAPHAVSKSAKTAYRRPKRISTE